MGVNQKGLRDFIIQRISALVMIAYLGFLFAFFVGHVHHLDYARWHALFASAWMQVSTVVVLGFMLWHTWIGLWTVCTDYIKCPVMRLTFEIIILLALVAFFFWGLDIMWSV